MEHAWQPVREWKQRVTLARLRDLDPDVVTEKGWQLPADRMGDRWPKLAALSRQVALVRIEGDVEARVRQLGITTHVVGFHRVSEGWEYERGPRRAIRRSGELFELLHEALPGADDAAIGRAAAEAMDAILRVLSEGRLDERAVMIAAALPPVGVPGAPLEVGDEELDALEADVDALPSGEPPAILEAVRAALSRAPADAAAPRVAPAPPPAPSLRRHAPVMLRVGVSLALAGLLARRYVGPVGDAMIVLGLVAVALALVLRSG